MSVTSAAYFLGVHVGTSSADTSCRLVALANDDWQPLVSSAGLPRMHDDQLAYRREMQ